MFSSRAQVGVLLVCGGVGRDLCGVSMSRRQRRRYSAFSCTWSPACGARCDGSPLILRASLAWVLAMAHLRSILCLTALLVMPFLMCLSSSDGVAFLGLSWDFWTPLKRLVSSPYLWPDMLQTYVGGCLDSVSFVCRSGDSPLLFCDVSVLW